MFVFDISDSSIEVLIAEKKPLRRGPLLSFLRTELEPGIVADGEVINGQLLKKTLDELFERNLKRRYKKNT